MLSFNYSMWLFMIKREGDDSGSLLYLYASEF